MLYVLRSHTAPMGLGASEIKEPVMLFVTLEVQSVVLHPTGRATVVFSKGEIDELAGRELNAVQGIAQDCFR